MSRSTPLCLALLIATSCRSATRTADPTPVTPAAPAARVVPRLLSVQKIWDAAPHNAFTDLVRFNDHWYCAFREGSAHIPGTDGVIRVLRSPDATQWESVALVRKDGVDLRDAKLSVTPDRRLMLLMGGSLYAGQPPQPNRTFTRLRTRVSFSGDGRHFTAPQDVIDDRWLWRLTWHDGQGYGAAYGTDPKTPNTFTLYRTTDGLLYQKVTDLKPPTQASEATVRFLPDHTMVMLVRGEPGSATASLGLSKPPYTDWSWHDTRRRIQGPDLVILPNQQVFYAARDYPDGKAAKTTLGQITLLGTTPASAPHATTRVSPATQPCQPLITLPSGGDTSYPGLALSPDGTLLMSYYSSHEGKAAIYLAKFALGH